MTVAESGSLSTAAAARLLGVSVSTVKRWVDQQLLPAERTAGGHRKIRVADLLRLQSNETAALPAPAVRRAARPKRREEPPPDALWAALRAGDQAGVRLSIAAAHQAGWPMARIADELIAPAVNRLGHEWQNGTLDVFHEHRGSQMCAEVLHELRGVLLGSADSARPLALGGTPAGDFYYVSSLLAEMVLLESGWRTVNLGPNTPLASFGRAVAELKPRLLWLSVHFVKDGRQFVTELRRLQAAVRRVGTTLIMGGPAIGPSVRAAVPDALYGEKLARLAEAAHTLHPPPVRPRRGWPRGKPRSKRHG